VDNKILLSFWMASFTCRYNTFLCSAMQTEMCYPFCSVEGDFGDHCQLLSKLMETGQKSTCCQS